MTRLEAHQTFLVYVLSETRLKYILSPNEAKRNIFFTIIIIIKQNTLNIYTTKRIMQNISTQHSLVSNLIAKTVIKQPDKRFP
mgnify:FL=1